MSDSAGSRWIGRPIRRREDRRLLTGRARYLDDLQPPGCAHVVFVRSDHAHARVLAVDAAAATAAPGVLAVVDGAALAPHARPFPNRVAGLRPVPYRPLATDRVRFAGEPVAAVVATSRAAAADAAAQVVVRYEPLPVVTDVDAARRPGAPRLYDEWPDNVLVTRRVAFGDVDGAFAAADVVIDETFTSQRQAPLPLEGRGTLAVPDGDALTVWSSTQVPHILRSVLAEVLDVAEPQLRVIAPDVGGGFGAKYQIFREEAAVACLARMLGRPVKWSERLGEHLASAVHAREQRVRLELAARADGTVTAMRATVVGDVGTAAAVPPSWGAPMVVATTCALGLRVEHFAYTLDCVVTNKCPGGAYRGFGNPVRVFAVERSLDLLAARLGLDPAEVRRRNLVGKADLPYRSVTGARIESATLPEAMDRALEMVDYGRFRERQAAARRHGRHLGVGIASFAEGTAPSFQALGGLFGAYDSCTLRVTPDGRIVAQMGVPAQGQGLETTIAQVVAEALGVDPTAVTVRYGDTDAVPVGLGAWGSRGCLVAAGAGTEAARVVRDKMLAIAAHLLEAHPDDLRVADGRAVVKGAESRAVGFREIAAAAYGGRARLPAGLAPGLEATAFFEPEAIDAAPDRHGRAMRYATVANAAHVAVVEVLVDTGEVKLLDYVVVHDCGTIVNPLIVDGQIRGGVAQGIAGALYEHLIYDESGQLLSGSLLDYHVPRADEIPDIRVEHLVSPDPRTPWGIKGVGEGGTIGAPAAIANAVADALAPFGVRVVRTPLTPPEVRRLLAAAGGPAAAR